MTQDIQRRLALLIDADNAQAALLEQMLIELSKYGTITIRRVYGDFTEANMKGWKEVMHTHALQPVQQFRYTVGKNATDSALIIDAMDILYTAGIDGVCIASSDSDYTRLATRLREKNLYVIGIGKQMTPRAFVNACNLFIYTENLEALPADEPEAAAPFEAAFASPDTGAKLATAQAADAGRKAQQPKATARTAKKSAAFEKLFRTAFGLTVQDDGWANLSALGDSLRKLDSAFDPRTYGHSQLSQLVRAFPELIEVKPPKAAGKTGTIFVRAKADAAKAGTARSGTTRSGTARSGGAKAGGKSTDKGADKGADKSTKA
jgi:uncharacterized LabA/DUF88 family protein